MVDDEGFFYRFRSRVEYTDESQAFAVTGPERVTREEAEADIAATHEYVKVERNWIHEGAQAIIESIATIRYEPCFAR